MTDSVRLSPGVMFVGHYRVPAGRVDEWRADGRTKTAFVEANLPDVFSFDAYLSADGTEGTSIHLHRDAESFERYLAAMATMIGQGMQIVEVTGIDLYGAPRPEIVERLRQMGSFPVRVHAHENGFGQ
jgi:hypothetical protein